MRKLALSCVVAVAAMAIPSAASAGGGPPVVVFTETVTDSATVPFGGACGGTGMVTVEFHDVFHVTEFADGTVHVSGNQNGTFAFDPDDAAAPSSSGHYRNGFTFSATNGSQSSTSVFSIIGRDDNGDRVKAQVREHITYANGELRVEIFEVRCG